MGYWFGGIWFSEPNDQLAVPIQGVEQDGYGTNVWFGAKMKSDIDKAMGL